MFIDASPRMCIVQFQLRCDGRRHLSNATIAPPPEAVASLGAMDGDDAPMPTPASDTAPRFDLLLAHTDSVFCVMERAPSAGKLLLVSDSARNVLGAHPDDLVTCVAPLSRRRCALGLTVPPPAASGETFWTSSQRTKELLLHCSLQR